jgi:hypothetical protein
MKNIKEIIHDFFYEKTINNNGNTCADFALLILLAVLVLWFGITHP